MTQATTLPAIPLSASAPPPGADLMSGQQTIVNARKKIAQLEDATDAGDLLYRHGVASGWLAALRLEGLIDAPTFEQLAIELDDTYRAAAPGDMQQGGMA